MSCGLGRGLDSLALLLFERLNHPAHHVPCFEQWPASNGYMITRDATVRRLKLAPQRLRNVYKFKHRTPFPVPFELVSTTEIAEYTWHNRKLN